MVNERKGRSGEGFRRGLLPLMAIMVLMLVSPCRAEEELHAGKVAALRGKSVIERGKEQITPAISSDILASDIIKTGPDGKIKLKFVDGSVLTLGENSKLVVKEFLYTKGKGGKSTFNLLQGKMHSIVGKTKFEVHTPTAIAAARGTVIYFEVGDLEEEGEHTE